MLRDIRVSCSPHISGPLSTRRVMADVIIALVPAMAAAVYFFRTYALILIATCVISCLATEWVCNLIRKKPNPFESLGDLSAVITGIILALSVPPALPVWAAIIGSVFAIAVGKMVFGGLGSNIFNPAMVGRAFLTASFGMLMTTWTVPATINSAMPKIGPETAKKAVEVQKLHIATLTQATPLAHSKEAIKSKSGTTILYMQLPYAVFGAVGGCLGETSAIAILIGGAYMLLRKTITIHTPLAMLVSTFVFALIANLINPEAYMNPFMHIASGGIMLCAFFIATDPVTAPLSVKGMWIFGVGVGTLTMLIRTVGGYPEGVMFSVLLMNAVTPLIDRLCKLTPAGGKL